MAVSEAERKVVGQTVRSARLAADARAAAHRRSWQNAMAAEVLKARVKVLERLAVRHEVNGNPDYARTKRARAAALQAVIERLEVDSFGVVPFIPLPPKV